MLGRRGKSNSQRYMPKIKLALSIACISFPLATVYISTPASASLIPYGYSNEFGAPTNNTPGCGPLLQLPIPSSDTWQQAFSTDMINRINAARYATCNSSVQLAQLQVDPTLTAEAQAWADCEASAQIMEDPQEVPGNATCASLYSLYSQQPPISTGVVSLGGNSGVVALATSHIGGSPNLEGCITGQTPGVPTAAFPFNGCVKDIQGNTAQLSAGFMSSPPHRQGVLDAGINRVGFGGAVGTDGNYYVAEYFGASFSPLTTDAASAAGLAASAAQANEVNYYTANGDGGYPPYTTVGTTATVGKDYWAWGTVDLATGNYDPNSTTLDPSASASLMNQGYRLVSSGGAVYNFGDAINYEGLASGSPNSGPYDQSSNSVSSSLTNPYKSNLNSGVGIATVANGQGYWITNNQGSIYSSGEANTYLDLFEQGLHLNKPIVGMASPDTTGYWLVASDGGIFAGGDAQFYGSTGAMKLNKPIVGMASTPDGKGYWLVASDGGIFSFGDAQFYGSTGAMKLNKPVVGMASTPDGKGYWLVASDGGIFSFGDAQFYGSTGAITLNKPIVGMASTPDGKGYWLAASDGGIFSFGDAQFHGSLGGQATDGSIVGISATPY